MHKHKHLVAVEMGKINATNQLKVLIHPSIFTIDYNNAKYNIP